jgi:outer membrane receptor protein involved in Fe transport
MRVAWGVLFLGFFISAGSSLAQTVGASLQGTVYDPSGRFVPGATIEIRNVEKGGARTLTADDHGRYREPLLPPGEYDLRMTVAGFQPVVLKGIQLTVGQDAVLDLKLQLMGGTESVNVTADDSPPIDLASAALSGTVNRTQMNDLPLNGRSFQELALLQPGVSAAVAAGSDAVGGRGKKITINGARPEQNSFLLDGTDINNVYNKTPGSVAGVLLGVETVQEFQVLTNSYSAEFGRSSGGIINAITRSGTNKLHGNLFEYLRNSALDAKNYFDPGTDRIPPFKRNQFGGTLGGPIRRDKTFFFGAFEAIKERLGITGLTSVPDDNARNFLLPCKPPAPGCLRPVQVSAANRAAVSSLLQILFPPANGPVRGGGVAEYSFTRGQPTDEYFAQGRIDHRFSEKDTFFGRYTFDNGKVYRQPRDKPPVTFFNERSRNQYLTLEHVHSFSQVLINTLRVSFARSTAEVDNQRTVDVPTNLWWIPPSAGGLQFGFLTIQGLVTEMVGDYRLPRNDHLNNYQWHDTLFLTKGAHGLRFGAEGQRMQFNQHTTSQLGGIETFTSLENFLKGAPQQINFAVPGRVDPDRGFRQSFYAFFLQDDYRWKPNVTLNLGLRYEFATVPTEVNGKISNLRSIADPAMVVGDPWYSNPALKDFAPRIGLAWDPFKNGKTSVRAGFGIFYDQLLPKYYVFSGSLNPPFTTRTSRVTAPAAPLSFPNAVQGPITTPICPATPSCIKANLQTINYDLQPSYIMQYNLSVQRALPGNWDVTVAYAGSHGLHLIRVADANLAPYRINAAGRTQFFGTTSSVTGLVTCCRRNANFGGVTQRATDAQSFYNSLQAGVSKRLSHGLRAQFSYTFGRSIDEASGINSQDFDNSTQYSINFFDRKTDRGLSSFSVKHVLVANWSYELPFGQASRGATGTLVKGWQLNSVVTAQSGTPFEVRLGHNQSGNLNTIDFSIHERPDVRPGMSNNPVTGDPKHWFDASAFVLQPANTIGNLGRNTLIGPKLVNCDFSLFKQFALTEGKTLHFRAEMFNIFNHPNFGVPNSANRTALLPFTDPDGVTCPTGQTCANPNSSAGAILNTVTTSRQIQFGLKFTF